MTGVQTCALPIYIFIFFLTFSFTFSKSEDKMKMLGKKWLTQQAHSLSALSRFFNTNNLPNVTNTVLYNIHVLSFRRLQNVYSGGSYMSTIMSAF